jgi:LysR family transcriptional activator of nhaA
MNPWLNYHHLFYFYQIAKEGGVARAAKTLRLGQPTLSTQLKQFEDTLGCKLLLREKGQHTLTEEGKMAFEYAAEIFRLGNEFLETLQDRKGPSRIHLQIGALDVLPKALIHRVVEAAQSFGDCYVSVLEGPYDYLMRELVAHRIDIALTDSPVTGPEDEFRSRKVAEFPVVVCASPDILKAIKKQKKLFPDCLNEQSFIFPTAHSRLRQELEHFFETQKIRVRPAGETQDLEIQKFFVRSGKALAALPFPAVEEWVKDGLISQVGVLEHLHEELWMTAAKRKYANPMADQLMKSFKI